jgi:hypothetical protein
MAKYISKKILEVLSTDLEDRGTRLQVARLPVLYEAVKKYNKARMRSFQTSKLPDGGCPRCIPAGANLVYTSQLPLWQGKVNGRGHSSRQEVEIHELSVELPCAPITIFDLTQWLLTSPPTGNQIRP